MVTPKYLNLLSSSLDTPVEQGTYYSQEASVPAGCQGLRNVACLIFVSTLSRVTLLPIDRRGHRGHERPCNLFNITASERKS